MLRNILVMLLFKYDFKLSIVSEFKVKKITFMLSQTHHHHQPTKTHKMVNKRYLSLCINVYVRILVVVSLDNEEPPKTKKESSLSKTCEIKRQNCCSYYDYTWKKRPTYWCPHNKHIYSTSVAQKYYSFSCYLVWVLKSLGVVVTSFVASAQQKTCIIRAARVKK